MSTTPVLSSRYSRSVSPWGSLRGTVNELNGPIINGSPVNFNLPSISKNLTITPGPEIRSEIISRNEVASQGSALPLVPLNSRRQTIKANPVHRNYKKQAVLNIIPMEDFELESWRRFRDFRDVAVISRTARIIFT
jgi:hypothetical protein